MTPAEQVIERIHAAGGILTIKGDRIVAEVFEDAAPLLDELRAVRDEAYRLLQQREVIPKMPPGVRLISWQPKEPPVVIEHCSVVTDTRLFAIRTLEQLAAALQGQRWLAGNWSVRQLVDRLEQCGVVVEVKERSIRGEPTKQQG